LRIALGVEYEGSAFAGWEDQPRQRTVQAQVEAALARVADHPVRVVCAGRTDAGVHAWGQVVHFDTSARREPRAWLLGGNANLGPDASFTWVRPVADEFDARRSARRRHYRYLIYNDSARSALLRERACWECRPLDAERMQAGGLHLLGEHDFSAFRAAACQARSPVRRVERIDVSRHGRLIAIDVVANAFLHHMVRNIAGVLMAVGLGRRGPDWPREVLSGRERARGGVTAPPQGLYLVAVQYPERFALPPVSPPRWLW
jgi:tRNA pseudouridine38-40 synthase